MNFGLPREQINHPQYPNSFTPVTIPKQLKYVHTNYRLIIKSTDRDRSIYRNPNEFRIDLPRRYRNVSVVECGVIMLPNFSNSEKYFLIQVNELQDGPYDSLDPHISKAIALVPNRNGLGNYNYIVEQPGDNSYVKNYIKKFVDTPLASLSTFTLKIKKPDGNIVNFGQDLLPYDKETHFEVDYSDYDAATNKLTVTSLVHELADDPNVRDQVEIINAKISYYKNNQYGNKKRITDDLSTLNKIYPDPYSNTNNIVFEVDLDDIQGAYINPPEYPNINTDIKISGTWKRAKNNNNYYSRVLINTITNIDTNVDTNEKTITVTTATAHYLKDYDRIFISPPLGSTVDTSVWYNSYHVVLDAETTATEFKLNIDNVTLRGIMDDVTQNPVLPDDVQNNGDIIDTTMIVNDPNIPNQSLPTGNFGYLQKYGEPDPSIQSMFIFNINTRDVDDEQVRSENISFGNL